MWTYLIPILAVAGLSAGWGAVQLLARKLGTKNHIDHGQSCCGSCSGGSCTLETKQESSRIF